MKKIFIYITLLTVAFTMQSCLHDDKEIFSESAAERLDKAASDAMQLLESSENGWVLHYYSGEDYDGGGYTYLLKFKNGKAEVSSEIAPADMITTSSYNVVKDQGPVLTFDTFNEIMHYFAQPESDGSCSGDYEFVIMNMTDNLIKLKGKKFNNKMTLTRLEEGKNWIDYINSIAEYEEVMVRRYNVIENGAKIAEMNLNPTSRRLTLSVGEEFTTTPYCVAPNGLSVAIPINDKAQDFVQKEGSADLVCVNEGAENIELQAVLAPDYIVSLIGESIGMNDAAQSKTVTANSASSFTYTSEASWLTVVNEGNSIKINVSENNEGHPRTGRIKIENENGTAYISITQAEFDKDVAGVYQLQYIDSDGNNASQTVDLSSKDADGNITMKFFIGFYQLSTTLKWDEENAAFVWMSGQYCGKWSSYYVYNLFVGTQYWSATLTDVAYTAPVAYDESKKQTYAKFSGTVVGEEITQVSFQASTANPATSTSDFAGYIELFTAPVLVKVDGAGAKATTDFSLLPKNAPKAASKFKPLILK